MTLKTTYFDIGFDLTIPSGRWPKRLDFNQITYDIHYVYISTGFSHIKENICTKTGMLSVDMTGKGSVTTGLISDTAGL